MNSSSANLKLRNTATTTTIIESKESSSENKSSSNYHTNMKYTIAFCVLLGIVAQNAFAAPEKMDCSKLEEVIDDQGSAQGMTTLNDKYKLTTNADDYNKRCAEMAQAIKTLRKYNKDCYTSLTQQVFSAILKTRSAMNEAHCKQGAPEYNEALEAAKCIQENALAEVQEAERKTILASQVLLDANIPDDKLRMRRSCCAVLSSKTLFINATKNKCSKHEKTYNVYVDSYTSEALGLICPEIEKLECDKLEPLKTDGVAVKTKFFLNPMLALVKTLDH